MRIMIVDDELQVPMVLAESVQRQGHEAIAAGSGAAGLLAGWWSDALMIR